MFVKLLRLFHVETYVSFDSLSKLFRDIYMFKLSRMCIWVTFAGVGVAQLGSYLFAVGGHDGTNYLNSVEAYNPIADR